MSPGSPTMKRVELKRIVEFLWKGAPSEEKTPFANQGALPDNGSFSKNVDADLNKKPAKEFPEDEVEKLEGPMSIPRKLCFAMSFNLWILYFLVLGWLLPCRNHECAPPFSGEVERNLSGLWLLTNVETLNVKALPSLVILGYADGTEEKLAALASFDATFEWNQTLPFIPKKIQCNFENIFDADGDGIPDCILSGFNDVYAFNASNGHVFWHKSLPSEEGTIFSGFHPTSGPDKDSFLVGTYAEKLVVLDAKTGNKTLEMNHPCHSPFDIKVVTNTMRDNITLWSLICDYGDEVEAWGFGEQDVLRGGNLENKANASEFELLFSGSNSGGSIDFGCDVTPVPGGPLLLSWSDLVAMVTPEATAWERHFPDPLTVAATEVGHFASKENQVAAAVHNGTSTTVFLMEMKNGSITDSVKLQDRQVQSMEKISGDRDILLLKSLAFGYSFSQPSNITDPIPWEQTNFALVDFSSGTPEVKDILTTTNVRGSALNVKTNGEADLIIIKEEDGITSYHKFIIHGAESEDILCVGSKSVPHSSL